MSLFATERVPQPLVMDGIVRNDPAARTLTVLRPDQASGYQKVTWRMAHEALVRAEQLGWPAAGQTLWAHGVGQTSIAFGLPGPNLTLNFHFPVGKREYVELVSKPGLRALVTIDRSSNWFTDVRLLHGRTGS